VKFARRVPALLITACAIAAFALLLTWLGTPASRSSYLASFGFAFSTLLGGLVLLEIGYVTHARWLVVFWRVLEGIALGLPLAVIVFALLAPALRGIWHETPWFWLRSAGGLGTWVVLAELLRRGSLARDHARESWLDRSRGALGAVGLPLVGLSGSLAIFDWLMTPIPGWTMTGIALYVLTGGYTAALGVLAVCFWWLRRRGCFPDRIGAEHSSAVGRMLLSGVCLWAYSGASQLIIVWSANLPREAAFYVPHAAPPWHALVWLLVFGHFVGPFSLLLFRAPKRHPGFIALLGGWLVLMHAVDCYWLLAPSFTRAPRWLDLLPFALITLAFAAFGVLRFSSASPLPENEPELERSLRYEAS